MRVAPDDRRDRGSITIAMAFAVGVIMLIVVQVANAVLLGLLGHVGMAVGTDRARR